jgi:hypothetical protein
MLKAFAQWMILPSSLLTTERLTTLRSSPSTSIALAKSCVEVMVRSMDDITISTTYQNGKTYAKIEVGHNKNAIYLEGVSSSSLTKDSFKFYNHKAINLAEVSLSTNEDQSFTITSTQLLANATNAFNIT